MIGLAISIIGTLLIAALIFSKIAGIFLSLYLDLSTGGVIVLFILVIFFGIIRLKKC